MYLFLLIIEGLSLLLPCTLESKEIKGREVSGSITVSHTLFVNHIIIFGAGSFDEWFIIKKLTDLFCGAMGMTFTLGKSCFL